MFPQVGRFAGEVLDVGLRAVRALEGILKSIFVLVSTIESALEEQKAFRPLISSVDTLAAVVADLEKSQREYGPAIDRLDALELSRVRFEAECEGNLLKADGKLKAANNAEARERQLKRSYEKRDPFENGDDGLGPATDEHMRAVIAGDVAPREIEVTPPQSRKARALLAKWRMG